MRPLVQGNGKQWQVVRHMTIFIHCSSAIDRERRRHAVEDFGLCGDSDAWILLSVYLSSSCNHRQENETGLSWRRVWLASDIHEVGGLDICSVAEPSHWVREKRQDLTTSDGGYSFLSPLLVILQYGTVPGTGISRCTMHDAHTSESQPK